MSFAGIVSENRWKVVLTLNPASVSAVVAWISVSFAVQFGMVFFVGVPTTVIETDEPTIS